MSLVLEDEVLLGTGSVDRRKIEEFRIKGLSAIGADLREYDGWDGKSKQACVALRLDGEGKIFQKIVHLVGKTEPKRFEARVLLGKDYKHEQHQVKYCSIKYWQM